MQKKKQKKTAIVLYRTEVASVRTQMSKCQKNVQNYQLRIMSIVKKSNSLTMGETHIKRNFT